MCKDVETLHKMNYNRTMPVTTTAKRALRGSRRKKTVNDHIRSRLEIAVRAAGKSKSKAKIVAAISLADRAAKKHTIHKNKAARIKSALSKIKITKVAKAKKA
jgi:ribosomal protein S20